MAAWFPIWNQQLMSIVTDSPFDRAYDRAEAGLSAISSSSLQQVHQGSSLLILGGRHDDHHGIKCFHSGNLAGRRKQVSTRPLDSAKRADPDLVDRTGSCNRIDRSDRGK
jgi:hypothetical protein